MSKLERFCTKVILDLNNLELSDTRYQNKLLNMGQVAKDLYPEDYNSFLKEIRLDSNLMQWKIAAQEMLNLVDEYQINPYTKKISVKMGEEEIIKDIINIKEYIEEKLNLPPDSWKYTLALSILADVNTFELFQVANAIILD